MEHWSEEFVSEIIFSKYCSFDSCGDAINPKLGQKGPKLVFHAPMLIERWKSIVKGNLRWSIRFWKHYHKIFKFWLPMVTSSTEKWVKEAQIGTLCSNDDRKIKTKIKRYLEVNYSFMKPFFQNFKVLSQHGYVINPKLSWKRSQTRISRTNGDKRWKSKVKGNLWSCISLWNYFPENLKFQPHVMTSSSQNWVKNTQICISCTTVGKNIKIRNYENFASKLFFWRKNFWILKHQFSFWRHYFKTGTLSAELTSDMRFPTFWNWGRFQSLIMLVALTCLPEELLSRIPVFKEHH